jgi:hypothetical protein
VLLRLAALALLALALPASAGELIRYRAPDGSIGFVDDEKRLPAGVEVISRTPLDPPRPAPAADVAEPEATAAAGATAGDPSAPQGDEAAAACEDLADLRARTRCWRDRGERCGHHGLRSRCAAAEIATAEEWCARGDELRAELSALDEAHGEAQARIDACQRSGIRPQCAGEELEQADRALRGWERRMEALEEQCQAEECLPGWVREGCGFEPSS